MKKIRASQGFGIFDYGRGLAGRRQGHGNLHALLKLSAPLDHVFQILTAL